MNQVIPRYDPDGREKLRDGFVTQDTILLFRKETVIEIM
jgi:hypothetical protein